MDLPWTNPAGLTRLPCVGNLKKLLMLLTPVVKHCNADNWSQQQTREEFLLGRGGGWGGRGEKQRKSQGALQVKAHFLLILLLLPEQEAKPFTTLSSFSHNTLWKEQEISSFSVQLLICLFLELKDLVQIKESFPTQLYQSQIYTTGDHSIT